MPVSSSSYSGGRMEGEYPTDAEDGPSPTSCRKLRVQDLQKTSWLMSSRDDLSVKENVRPSFKLSQSSTYFPAAWSSGKLHAVPSGTLEITSVRMESFIPHSADKGLALEPDM